MIRFAPRTTKSRLRRWGHRLVRFLRGVVLLEDTPRRIALGSAIGIFFAAQPFVGSQMAAAALAARIVRSSVFASLPWTWLTNPFTVAPFYYASYRLGCVFFPADKRITYERIQALGAEVEGQGLFDNLKDGWRLLVDIALPLQIGATLLGLVLSVSGYFAIRRVVEVIQGRRLAKRRRWLSAMALASRPGEVEPAPPGVAVILPAVAIPADHLRENR
jgi:uncharacterized protein (DUF2062 family)